MKKAVVVIFGDMIHLDEEVIIKNIKAQFYMPEETAEAAASMMIDNGHYDSYVIPSLCDKKVINETDTKYLLPISDECIWEFIAENLKGYASNGDVEWGLELINYLECGGPLVHENSVNMFRYNEMYGVTRYEIAFHNYHMLLVRLFDEAYDDKEAEESSKKVQVNVKVVTMVTMVVDADDIEENVNDVMSNMDYDFNHDTIVDTEIIDHEIGSTHNL
jgi:hypothetical protein